MADDFQTREDALEFGREAVQLCSAFQPSRLAGPEEKIAYARQAISRLEAFATPDSEAEGLVDVLKTAIEENQQLINSVRRL